MSDQRPGYCPRDEHLMTETSTYTRPDGREECRACRTEAVRRARARRKSGEAADPHHPRSKETRTLRGRECSRLSKWDLYPEFYA